MARVQLVEVFLCVVAPWKPRLDEIRAGCTPELVAAYESVRRLARPSSVPAHVRACLCYCVCVRALAKRPRAWIAGRCAVAEWGMWVVQYSRVLQ